jgi:hypothetical protein
MIISIELNDADWNFICEELGQAALGHECTAEQFVDDVNSYDQSIEQSVTAERLDGYITTAVRNALERARPKFSEN